MVKKEGWVACFLLVFLLFCMGLSVDVAVGDDVLNAFYTFAYNNGSYEDVDAFAMYCGMYNCPYIYPYSGLFGGFGDGIYGGGLFGGVIVDMPEGYWKGPEHIEKVNYDGRFISGSYDKGLSYWVYYGHYL